MCWPKLTVHPHACGENACELNQKAPSLGSPPRVWGKLLRAMCVTLCNRFTPTRVGKTAFGVKLARAIAVHPHACGENPLPASFSSTRSGSPPRVWGKHDSIPTVRPLARFTPTRVGKTVSG